MSSTYTPTGTGICRNCGRDVGRHDGGHEFDYSGRDRLVHHTGGISGHRICRCVRDENDPIHDVGRELRCPEEARDD